MRIAVYGVGKWGEMVYQRLCSLMGKYDLQIMYFIVTKRTKNCFHGIAVKNVSEIHAADFDILVVAVSRNYSVLSELSKLKEWGDIRLKIKNWSQIEYFYTDSPENVMPYKSVLLNCRLKYLSTTKDYVIGEGMGISKINFAEEQVDLFFDLIRKYYKINLETGYFFDIGANIGTTCIYAKNKHAPLLKYIGFEAGTENYNLFRCNCILNKEEDIIAEHLALGQERCKGHFVYNETNSGNSQVVFSENLTQELDVISLDEYLQIHSIDKSEVRCIWIDTEGAEAEIILGMGELISTCSIPLMQEFNPIIYRERGKEQEYYELMEAVYRGFFDCRTRDNEHSIFELKEYVNIMLEQGHEYTDLFFF